jgi:opacity protein-like surface antigen
LARAAAIAIAALAIVWAASPATAQVNWAGPYLGPIFGRAAGTATYTFHTAGHYNTAAGDIFQHGVRGIPMGATLGYNWQNGTSVYGFEADIYSAIRGVSAYDVVNTVAPPPGQQRISLKGHWFSSVTARLGITAGPALFYVQGGPAYGHFIWELIDDAAAIHLIDSTSGFGFTARVGVELMDPERRYSIDFGYQYLSARFSANYPESVTNPGGIPAGPGTGTDHTVQYRTHALTVSLNYFGAPVAPGEGDPGPLIDWQGPYLAAVTGPPLREFGGGLGYNWVHGRLLFGAEVYGLAALCCGFDFEAMLNARVGVILRDNIVAYAEAGLSYLNGSLWAGYYTGLLNNVGVGVEVALGPRASGFMEMKQVRDFTGLPTLVNWVGGFNFELGGRH